MITISVAQRGKYRLERRDSSGTLIVRYESKFGSPSDFRKLANSLAINEQYAVSIVDQFERNGTTTFPYISALQPDVATCHIRGLMNRADLAIDFSHSDANAAFTNALLNTDISSINEPIIYWTDDTSFAAIDLDCYYDRLDTHWTDLRLMNLLDHFAPLPSFAWVTHGRGIRLIYVFREPFTAIEYAAMAYTMLANREVYRNLEIKKSTRHPNSYRGDQRCGPVRQFAQTMPRTIIDRWVKHYTADDQEVKDWLDTNGYRIGERYDHSRCPVNPSDEGKRQPVCVNEKGIHCFVCEATGKGFFPYAMFVSSGKRSILHNCFNNFVHWNHAAHYLRREFGVSDYIGKHTYATALKLYHDEPGDARINMALSAGRNLLRIDHTWTDNAGQVLTKDLRPIVKTLPACMDDKLKVNEERLTYLTQPIDLSKYGYASLSRVYSIKIFGHYQSSSNEYPYIVYPKYLQSEVRESFRPKYLSSDKRLPLDEAWNIIETICPGINHNLVYLLIAAKGITEGAYGMPAFTVITGPTGAAKTSTINIVAGIVGDMNTEILQNDNHERMRQSIMDGKELGSYVTCNEFFKDAATKSASMRAAIDFILSLTADSRSHKLYYGSIPMGKLPSLTFTDTMIPHTVIADQQISRRLVHVHLPNQLDWERSIIQSQLSNLTHIRLLGENFVKACDTILSYVIDTYFRELMSYKQIAESLGFRALNESSEAVESLEIFRDFYNELMNAPEVTGQDAIRWKGGGWRTLVRDEVNSRLSDLWGTLSDESDGGKWHESRRCNEIDWKKVLGAKCEIKFQIRTYGNRKIAIRFKRTDDDTIQLEPVAGSNGVYRHRDAINSESTTDWSVQISESLDDAIAKLSSNVTADTWGNNNNNLDSGESVSGGS